MYFSHRNHTVCHSFSPGEFVEKFNRAHESRIIKSAASFQKLSSSRINYIMNHKEKGLQYHRMFMGQRLVCGVGEIFVVVDGQFTSSHGQLFTASDKNPEVGSLERTAEEVAGSLTAVSDEGLLVSITRDNLLEQLQLSKLVCLGCGGCGMCVSREMATSVINARDFTDCTFLRGFLKPHTAIRGCISLFLLL
jgi:hypothetical protein